MSAQCLSRPTLRGPSRESHARPVATPQVSAYTQPVPGRRRYQQAACFAAAGAQAPDAPLAVYPLQQLHLTSPSLFARCLRPLMSHLASAMSVGQLVKPFVQLACPWTAHDPDIYHLGVWEDVKKRSSFSSSTLVMYIKPVPGVEAVCGADPAACSRSTGCEHLSVTFAGSAGDCCEDAASWHPWPNHHADEQHRQAEEAAQRLVEQPDTQLDAAFAHHHGLDVQYYGLVAQSKHWQASDGCYLIRTVQQKGPATCHCMHYSVMRVCQGVALADQEAAFWSV